jgi:ATP-dependent helicase/nuclease subunit B
LQNAAGIPTASAAGQTRRAHQSLDAWRAATPVLVCSWARLDGDAHRTASPLLARLDAQPFDGVAASALAQALRGSSTEALDDSVGVPVDRTKVVPGGVRPVTLQAECGFRAYADMRLGAVELETPTPGLTPKERGMLLHKAMELVWERLGHQFSLSKTAGGPPVWPAAIAPSVQAAITEVFKGRIPPALAPSIERERMRLERLIERSFDKELERAPFSVLERELQREVEIAGGKFDIRIDRIDRIEGGGCAIVDYKSGQPKSFKWSEERFREPQLIAYLLAERGRDVDALVNFSLSDDRAVFKGRAARTGLLPGIKGIAPARTPDDQVDAQWQTATESWIALLREVAAEYLAGRAPVEPSDVCRNCELTILCRRLELAESPDEIDHD